jgi:hypothetical protein
MLSNFFFFENRSAYGIMEKNTVKSGMLLMTIRRMRIALGIPMATNSHSEYVTRCFPLQQCLNEQASMLHYTYITRLVYA